MWALWSLLICTTLHPIHVSVTEMEYSEKHKSLQITSRVFIDDLETSVRSQLQQPSLDIVEPKNGLTTDQMAERYLMEHLKIKLDGKPVKIKYLAHEVEAPAFVFYLEIEKVKRFKSIEVLNNVIQETHDDQSNLVHVTYKGILKSVRLIRDKPSDVLKFTETK